ncbi:19013_t:CDS:2 [Rhizophagus irregularis]|nr:19013_t:CDS:2 [Rhizophagus irregularis]
MLTYSSDEPTYYSMLYNEETSSLSASSVNEDTLMELINSADDDVITVLTRNRLCPLNQVDNIARSYKVEDVIVIKLWHWINRKRNINGQPLRRLTCYKYCRRRSHQYIYFSACVIKVLITMYNRNSHSWDSDVSSFDYVNNQGVDNQEVSSQGEDEEGCEFGTLLARQRPYNGCFGKEGCVH